MRFPAPEGVTPAVERAIERGIAYLVSIREPGGYWGATPGNHDIYPVAITGLVGLALLAHGDTPTRGQHAAVVSRITEYLLDAQTSAGLFDSGAEISPVNTRKGQRPMFGHAFALTFLSQVYGQERDIGRRRRIQEAIQRGVLLTARVQSDAGGWAYRASYREDEGTLTVTQLQALRAARDAGIIVPKSVVDRGVLFIENSSNSNGSVRYRISSSEVRDGVTCAAVVALWNAGQYDTPLIQRTRDYVNRYVQRQWEYGDHGEYIEYYLAQAKWIMGGKLWSDYYRDASVELVGIQGSDGHWEGHDDREYGSTFATAIALIVLQLPYDRLPIFQR